MGLCMGRWLCSQPKLVGSACKRNIWNFYSLHRTCRLHDSSLVHPSFIPVSVFILRSSLVQWFTHPAFIPCSVHPAFIMQRSWHHDSNHGSVHVTQWFQSIHSGYHCIHSGYHCIYKVTRLPLCTKYTQWFQSVFYNSMGGNIFVPVTSPPAEFHLSSTSLS